GSRDSPLPPIFFATAGSKPGEETLVLDRGLPRWQLLFRTSRGQSQNVSVKSKVTWKLPYWRNISYRQQRDI
ncbi:hypothetical protein ILYODFUR_017761, partial [Ilyodon furcidens]